MTKIYGASDDLLEFEGSIFGEVNYFDSSEKDPIEVKVSDGTHFKAFYDEVGLWRIILIEAGTCFISLDKATDPNSENYSDILTLENEDELTAKYKVKGNNWRKVD